MTYVAHPDCIPVVKALWLFDFYFPCLEDLCFYSLGFPLFVKINDECIQLEQDLYSVS